MADEMDIKITAETQPEQTKSQPETQPEANPAEEKKFTQADVDRIVKERLNRHKDPAPKEPAAVTPDPAVADMGAKLIAMQQNLVQSEVKAQMAMAGIPAERVDRACRLIDANNCTGKDGQPDTAKIKEEIESILTDFPELKPSQKNGGIGFKIGADGTEQDKNNQSDEISRIFGNKN